MLYLVQKLNRATGQWDTIESAMPYSDASLLVAYGYGARNESYKTVRAPIKLTHV